MQTKIFSLILM